MLRPAVFLTSGQLEKRRPREKSKTGRCFELL